MLTWLNKNNGADEVETEFFTKCLTEFKDNLIGAVMGIAYGGAVEAMGKLWGEKGKVYGFDTFEDLHPKQLSKDPKSFEATCMDHWYDPKVLGTASLAYAYMRGVLDKEGLKNVILRKGLIGEDSLKGVPHLNYVFLDLDLYESMKIGYELVRNKIVDGGYLLLHDVVPFHHLPLINAYYLEEILGDKEIKWELVKEQPSSFIVALKKVGDNFGDHDLSVANEKTQ